MKYRCIERQDRLHKEVKMSMMPISLVIFFMILQHVVAKTESNSAEYDEGSFLYNVNITYHILNFIFNTMRTPILIKFSPHFELQSRLSYE